jgi:hypothetical protein
VLPTGAKSEPGTSIAMFEHDQLVGNGCELGMISACRRSIAIRQKNTAKSSTSKESEQARGMSAEEAAGIGYAPVNKQNPDAHRYSVKEKRQAGHIAYATVNKRAK